MAYEQAAHALIALSLMTSSNVETLSNVFFLNAVFYVREVSGYVGPSEFLTHADYEHGRPGQICGMLPVSEDNLSSMIYLSSNGLSGHKRT